MESDGGIRGGGELEVDREVVKARMNIDAGLVQGGMEIDIEACRQSFVCKLVPYLVPL